ncbi:MAG: tRNA 2-thiouridine(34) synthase MnmA, partial [bacterium]|nr:tRNA 2-thiouridine(34) synthase MnmA [bacterium]
GLSGGVDSAVSAALLKKEGYDVVAVFMRCWQEDGNPYCTALEDEQMARRVASFLDIPFYSWNFIDRYKEKVVTYLLDGYRAGLTPNPDMMCNREIKFGLFFEKAMALGADYVATGHYARVSPKEILMEGKDKEKDQSYFLSFVPQEAFRKTLFPIGEYTKPQVRALAKKMGLPNAERKDSQGICFIGKMDITEFLKAHIKGKPGNIVDMAGNVLGKHGGVYWYTVGQRHGLEMAGGPYYVVRQNIPLNTLVVTKDEKDLLQKRAVIQNINWISGIEERVEATARIRYRGPKVKAVLQKQKEGPYSLEFAEPQRAVTPGQFAVLYKGEQVICAGIIAL